MLRLTLKVVSLVLGGVVVYLAVTAVQVWLMSRRDEARPAQAIVVLGAAQYNGVPSPDLAARLDHTLALWRKNLAPTIVVTGGGERRDHFTEAEASAAYLEHRGVPRAVITEVTGRTTWESLSFAAAKLRERGEHDVLLVSDPFHSARIGDITAALGLNGYPSPTNTSPIRGIGTVPYFAKETIGVALGRVIGFSHLSDLHAGSRPLLSPVLRRLG